MIMKRVVIVADIDVDVDVIWKPEAMIMILATCLSVGLIRNLSG